MDVRATVSYQKVRQIGCGEGMNSTVFEVYDKHLSGQLAAKEIPLSSFSNKTQTYYEEARAIFSSQHRNIVPIQYAAESSDCICLVMPLFKNGSLQKKIEENPLPLKDIISLGQNILSGLSCIHSKGYLHLDIKPSNILFTDTNVPLITDFGQARTIDKNGLVTNLPPIYNYGLPPELLTYKSASQTSDIYQVGLTLFRAVNGNACFEDQKIKIYSSQDIQILQQMMLSGKFPDRNKFLPHVPLALKRVIKKALDVNCDNRWTSDSMRDALGRVDLKHNWEPLTDQSTGAMQWRALRPKKSGLLVDLLPKSKTKWAVEIFTDSEDGRKRAYAKDSWLECSSKEDALSHLCTTFEHL
jgi:eukaryotic-like serine/threonine-protein kinase